MSRDLPVKFVKVILEAHGREGAKWLGKLPQIIKEIENGWSLKVQKPYQNLSYHYVAPCTCDDGGDAVLKIGFPEEDSVVFYEAKMLKMLNGNGAVKLLRINEGLFALLLEKATPGENLAELCQKDGEKATEIAIELMRKIWRKAPSESSFPTVEKWMKGLERAAKSNAGTKLFKKAHNYFIELNALSEQKFLLHGDLHHENILSARREPFLAIDPKGLIGDAGYEISVFLNNQARWLSNQADRREKLECDVRQFAEAFQIKPRDVKKWAFVQAILSAWWTFEENGVNWKEELTFAEIWEI
jgi:streptomycin 6-kinase